MVDQIGLGVIYGLAAAHASIWADIFNRLPEVKLVAVADENVKRGREFASKYNARFYSNLDDLLKDKDVDFVQNSIENYKQASTSIKVIEAGKDIFCEKPTATSVEDSQRIVKAAKKAGIKTTVGFAWRFDPAFRKVKELLDGGVMGKICMVKMCMGHGDPRGWGEYGAYSIDAKRLGGGIFLELGCHCADMLISWAGEVESVSAQMNNIDLGFEGEDNAVATIRFKNGAIGEIDTTRSLETDYFDVRAEVVGSEADAVIDLKKRPSLCLYIGNAPITGRLYPSLRDLEDEYPETSGFRLLAENFVKSIIQDKEPMVVIEDAYRALRLIFAGYESAKTVKIVKVE